MCLNSWSLLPFKVHQIVIRKRRYLLLPKLAQAQMGIIAKRLEEKGCFLRGVDPIVAHSSEGVVSVSKGGVCRSTFDASDLVLPSIPEILASPRENTPLEDVLSCYLSHAKTKDGEVVRFSPRVESWSAWSALRADEGCALSPDEQALVAFVMSKAKLCDLVTDFPIDGSKPRRIGGGLYFDTALEGASAVSTLRRVGERRERNSYLKRDGILRLHGFSYPDQKEWLGLFADLGDWCSYIPY